MSTPSAPLDRRGGLANVIDIVIAPAGAFERLRLTPVWAWAFLVATLLGIAGALLAGPAIVHAMERSLPAQLAANPRIMALPPEKQQAAIAQALGFSRVLGQISWIFVPLILLVTGLLQALMMTIANAVTRGDGSFSKFFALSITVAIVGAGFASLVLGLIAEIRGASAFDDPAAVQSVVPGLALLVPGAHGALAGFLTAFSVFSLWATGLLALGMTAVARIPRPAAWGTAIAMLLLAAAFGAVAAAQQG